MLHDLQLQKIIYGMLNYLQASPEAKARLLMQKEKRKRDSASERGIEKRQKIHLASMRAILSQYRYCTPHSRCVYSRQCFSVH